MGEVEMPVLGQAFMERRTGRIFHVISVDPDLNCIVLIGAEGTTVTSVGLSAVDSFFEPAQADQPQ